MHAKAGEPDDLGGGAPSALERISYVAALLRELRDLAADAPPVAAALAEAQRIATEALAALARRS